MHPTAFREKYPLGMRLKDILLIGILFSLVADFRRLDGDTGSMVVIMAVANVLFSCTLLFFTRTHNRQVVSFVGVILVFSIASSITGISRGQPTFEVLAQALPTAIFALSAWACATYIRSPEELDRLLTLSIVSAILAAAWRIYFAFQYFELTLTTVRYQVLSGATPLLFAYALAGFFAGKRRLMWLALAMSLGVVFVAVTRTYIIVFLCSACAALLLLSRSQLKKIAIRLAVLLAGLVLILGLLQLLLPELGERWIGRLFVFKETGVEVTALTRIAEIKGQLEQMEQDFVGLIFGFGMRSVINWSGQEMDIIASAFGANYDLSGYGYGHNFYIGSIYVGGILFGLPMILAIITSTALALVKLKRSSALISPQERFAAVFAVCGSIGYCCFGLFGGTLGDRSMSLYYGVATALQLRFLFSKRITKSTSLNQ